MVSIPGVAVNLLGLLACLIALGIIQLTRYLLRPLLESIAFAARIIPLVGGAISRAVLKIERIVDGYLAHAALTTEGLAGGFFHGLAVLASHIGSELAGLAADVWSAINRLVVHTIPRFVHNALHYALRVARAIESRFLHFAHWATAQVRAIIARIIRLEHYVVSQLGAVLHKAEAFAADAIHKVVGGLQSALSFIGRAITAAEHRIGQLEYEVFNKVWKELERLGELLNPERLFTYLWNHVITLVGHELWAVLEWLWHWANEGIEFFYSLITGKWPPPMHRTAGKGIALNMHKQTPYWGKAIREEHGR